MKMHIVKMPMTDRARVCMLTYALPPEHSGAALQGLRLAKRLFARQVQVFFISATAERTHLGIVDVGGVSVVRIFKGTVLAKMLAPGRFFWALLRRRHKFDIIHVHGIGYIAYVAAVFGLLFHKKVLAKMTLFDDDDLSSIKQRPWGCVHSWFLSRINHFVGTTRGFHASCIRAHVSAEKLSLIPNGVDTEQFSPVSAGRKWELRRTLGVPLDAEVLVYAGIIMKVKRFDFLLDVIARVRALRPKALLVLLGPAASWVLHHEAGYVSETLGRIDELARQGVVLYRGAVTNVEEYLQASDIFISASEREGFPNVLLEAMACGLPPIVVDIPDVYRWILTDGRNGIVVAERNTDAFVARLVTLMDRADLRRSIAVAARDDVLRKYALDSVANSYVHLYDRLNRTPPGRFAEPVKLGDSA